MLNRIDIMGRLTRDPEMRRTQSGKPVTSFTLAVDRDYNKGEVDFIDCVAWNNTAEFVNSYFEKGRMAVVSGRLQFREWTDRNGSKRKNAEVIVENIYFGESKRESTKDEYSGYTEPTFGYGKPKFDAIEDDGDLPF